MAQPDSAQKVIHVTLSGQMFQGKEEWQTGFYVGSATADPGPITQQWVDAIRDAWATFFTSADSFIGGNYTFTQAKAALLEKNGKYANQDTIVSFPTTTKYGAWGASVLPPQISLVATLIGGSGKGLGGKGRMYLPGVSAPPGNDATVGSINTQKICTGLAAFFNAVDASVDAPGHAINVSRGHKTDVLGIVSYSGARNVPINGVRVGNIYDTQRRRRNGFAETYVTAVVND